MEDAPEEERDAKLQKVSSDLINDFDRSLSAFLRRPDGQLRTRVRTRETTRLTSNVSVGHDRTDSPPRTFDVPSRHGPN